MKISLIITLFVFVMLTGMSLGWIIGVSGSLYRSDFEGAAIQGIAVLLFGALSFGCWILLRKQYRTWRSNHNKLKEDTNAR